MSCTDARERVGVMARVWRVIGRDASAPDRGGAGLFRGPRRVLKG